MPWWQMIVLAAVQGIAEFLPISSSGHIVVLGKLFGVQELVELNIVLHLGTLGSILVFYRRRIWELLTVQRRHRLCLSEAGPRGVTGVGNYVLRVRASRSARMAVALYFLDSGAYNDLGVGHYAWIARDQIAWFLASAKRLRLPALTFFHIPLPEWDEAWRNEVCRGHRHEPVCGPALNSGFFAAMVESGRVMGAFCGHDHVNDFEGELHGIRLCYGRATGFGEYGKPGFPRGARVIRLREGRRGFETWLRLEGGVKSKKAPVHEPEAWPA